MSFNKKKPKLKEIIIYIQAKNEAYMDLRRFRTLMSAKYSFNKQESRQAIKKLMKYKLIKLNRGNGKLSLN